ncbi:MAG: TonB-dependent receptor, partial [Melioribacteraceae bacterium]|nr:TonB-dependent receptor [Melioribacteraceae bacterium]
GGPIIPGNNKYTFFLSGERGWFRDGDPTKNGLSFESIGYSSDVIPNNNDEVWRVSGRFNFALSQQFNLQVGGNYVDRNFRVWDDQRASTTLSDIGMLKNNSEHNRIRLDKNLSFNAKLSQNIGASSFWNFIIGYQNYDRQEGDGIFFDDLEAYGDTLKNAPLAMYGAQADQANLTQDDVGIWAQSGAVDDYYRTINNTKITGDFNFTSQVGDHLVEAGLGGFYGDLSYYAISPVTLAKNVRESISPAGDTIAAKTELERYQRDRPTYFGYDIYGNRNTSTEDSIHIPTKNPVLAYAFIQDRFELDDLVLNLGLRLDYFDSKTEIFKDPTHPYSGGSDPNDYDPGDFETKDPELHFSPRIGLGFPVTNSTVFHAQYGRFVQEPRLIDLYSFQRRLDLLKQTSDFSLATGFIESQVTTSYEVGFRQVLGNNAAALNITAFYKNTEGQTNLTTQVYYRTEGTDGEELDYYTQTNQDFGTIKGFAFSLTVSRLSYFSLSLDYTFSIAEGTGSSSTSSFTAAFRNEDGEIPKVIAPLDYDQRHTGVLLLDFYIPKGELGGLEMLSANFLVTFATGRPYTPLQEQNLLQGSSNWGNTKGYVNSTYGPGNFRVDFKLEKAFTLGTSTIITPYVWIENLFNGDNTVDVWRSTGSAYTTEYLATEQGQKLSAQNGDDWVDDYQSLERDPRNFGVPLQIKLGLKINFASL